MLFRSLTFGSSGSKLYLNGAEEDTDASTAVMSSSMNELIIGQRGDLQSWFNGKIDEIIIYDRQLSQPEISELYNSGNGYNPYLNVTTSISGVVDVLIWNSTNYVTSVDEGVDFDVRVNYTYSNNTIISDGNCDIFLEGGVSSEHASDSNFTVCGNVGCDYNPKIGRAHV